MLLLQKKVGNEIMQANPPARNLVAGPAKEKHLSRVKCFLAWHITVFRQKIFFGKIRASAFFDGTIRKLKRRWGNSIVFKLPSFMPGFSRLALIICIALYLPGANFSLPQIKGGIKAESGVGGSSYPEEIFFAELFLSDLEDEFIEIPEPEEYPPPKMLVFSYHTVERGDIIGNIAVTSGLNEDTIISANNINNTRLIQIGQTLRIPNQDGIFYEVRSGDTLEDIASKNSSSIPQIVAANELFSENLSQGARIFVPGGRMDWIKRQEINGDLFTWPVNGRLSSPYGWRQDPFGRGRQFHTGIDIAAPVGTPARAALYGNVVHTGFDSVFGNFVIINHHSGYRTLYAHLNRIQVRVGHYVANGQRIGDVGNTGLSTGPHLHFTVYKNGATVNPRTLLR